MNPTTIALIVAALVAISPAAAAAPTSDAQAAVTPVLRPGLARIQDAITMDEYRFMSALAKQKGVAELMYLNKYGEVRWHHDPTKLTMSFQELLKVAPRPTKAVTAAFGDKKAASEGAADGGAPWVALPIVDGGGCQGMISMRATDAALAAAVALAKKHAPSKKAAAAPGAAPEMRRASLQHYLSGLIHHAKGDAAGARKEWDLALQLDRGNVDAKDGLAMLGKTLR